MSEAEAVRYIRQVTDALKYVHSLNRLHLDIKPDNIMVDKNSKAILIDFGTSKHYDDECGENTSTLMGVNTKGYAKKCPSIVFFDDHLMIFNEFQE